MIKNDHRLHLLSSKHRASANAFNNGANTGLVVLSHTGITSKGTVWNTRQNSTVLEGGGGDLEIF